MSATATSSTPPPLSPPPGPRAARVDDYGNGFRLSLIVHALLIAAVLIKSLVFPGNPVPYVPTLRVDIVGLPDVLKKDLNSAPPPGMEQVKEALKKADEQIQKAKEEMAKAPKAKEKAEPAEPDEMVLKPKAESKAAKAKEKAAREKKIKGALARIKALEKIAAEANAAPGSGKNAGVLIKGNKISRGTSLSGDARESDQANYYDSVRTRLQDNWALPVWLARQKYSAQVQIFIDTRGRLRSFRFLKLSGNGQFDAAVKQCLSDSQPFPVPPESISSSVLVDGILVGFPL